MSMRSLGSRRPLVAALGILAATVAGCSSQPATGSSSSAPSASSVDAVVAVVFRSSPAYEADGRALYLARQALIGRCMTRRGFAYRPSPLLPEPAGAGRPATDAGYGLYRAFATLDSAERAAVRAARTPSAQPQARYLRRLAPDRRAAYGRAMDGSSSQTGSLQLPGAGEVTYPTGGCYGRAIERLHGSLRRYYRLLTKQNAAGRTVAARLSGDARLQRSLAAWQRCMAARHLRHRSPEQARQRAYRAYLSARRPATARAVERTTASADRACARSSDVSEEQTRAKRAAVGALSDADRAAMVWLGRLRALAAERARAIVAREGPVRGL